ncbi:MAG: metallophosphoesterase [Oscillospiraceae bacterium]|nr:metallophosphoesterase [Oscillospiraceae bacterium]
MKKLLMIAAMLLLPVAFIVLTIVHTNVLRTTQFTWQSRRVPPAFCGFRIVQLSDLHNARFGREQSRLIRAVAQAQPDLIALTGDFIDHRTRSLAPVEELLEGIAPLAPIVFIDGNHDPRSDFYPALLELFAQHGVTVLQGEYGLWWHDIDESLRPVNMTVERDGARLSIGGVHDFDADIVLLHDPSTFAYYAEGGRDGMFRSDGLVLAGHMHGGQVALPGGQAMIAPMDNGLSFFPPYSSGVYLNGDATMFLSRGLGTSHLPIRLFATPEVAVIELKAE